MDAFDEFFFEHYGRVVASLTLAGSDPASAEDAAQDAFAKAMHRWRSVSSMDRPATWVYVVAVRDLRRRARRRREREQSVPSPDAAGEPFADHAAAVIDAEVVERALLALPPRQRLAVVLRFYSDLTVPEVGRAMDCSEGTVKSTLHTALAHLRINLGDRGFEGAHDGS